MKRVNFKKLLEQLKAAGIPHYKIAKQLKVTAPAISRIYSGITADPSHSTGEGIIAMHNKHVKGIK